MIPDLTFQRRLVLQHWLQMSESWANHFGDWLLLAGGLRMDSIRLDRMHVALRCSMCYSIDEWEGFQLGVWFLAADGIVFCEGRDSLYSDSFSCEMDSKWGGTMLVLLLVTRASVWNLAGCPGLVAVMIRDRAFPTFPAVRFYEQ